MGKLIKVWDGSTWQDVSVLAASSADKVSKSGGDTITSVTASTKGLSIQGAASQTANLQEWLNSAGTVLSSIASNGNGKFNGILIGQTAASASPSNISIGDSNTGASLTSTSTANVFIGSNAGASVGGYSNNTLIGHSAGRYNYGQYNTFLGSSTGILNGGGGGHNNVYIGYQAGYSGVGTGNVMIGYTAGQNTPGSNQLVIANSNISTPLIGGDFSVKTLTFAGNVTITSQATGTSGLIVKGAASQTADLQQWQNSAGTVLANVDSSGNIYTSSTTIWAGYNRATDGSALYNFTSVAGANYAQASIVRESGFNGNLRIDQQGNGAVLIQNGSAAGIGLIVKGYASQTANLQEWQNSNAVSVASISSTGTINTKPVGFSGNLNKAIISVTDTSSTWTPGNFAFRSDSGGIPRFSFTAPNASSEALTINGNSVGVQTPSPMAVFQVTSNAAGNIATIIKAAASQTASLTEWQNSSGTVLSKIDSAGKLTAIPNDGTISTAATNVGYMGIPQNSITTGAYTVVAADAGEHIYSSATRTITIDSNANLALPVGTVLTFISGAGATTTIAITSDTMYLAGAGTTGSRTLAPHGMATAVKVASTTWYISGNGLT